jgi:AcrR family transcriptional regulator
MPQLKMVKSSRSNHKVDCRRGRPCDEHRRERRCEEILDKATEVFAEHGYRNTDVQYIADPLEIGKATIYRYFPTKERLFLAAVERGVRRLDEAIELAVGRVDDPIAKMTVAIRAYLEFFETHPDLVELFIQERAEFRDRPKAIYFEHSCDNKDQWRQSLLAAMTKGRLRKMPAERIMAVTSDLLYGTMFTNHFAGRDKPFEEQARDIQDVLFRGIFSDSERRRIKQS